jgi:hypothetical protein
MAAPETEHKDPETQQKDPETQQKDVVSRLADRGEEALQRLSDLPGGKRALQAFNDLRARTDEMSKKVRGIDALEARVAKLEKELAALRRSSKPKPKPGEPKP